MHAGFPGHALAGFGQMSRYMAMQRMTADAPASPGDRLVAANDSNADGMLGIAELSDTRLGRKLSVDQFARIDANDDGWLDAGELNDALPGRRVGHWRGMMENAMMARFAEYLAERPPEAGAGSGIVGELMDRLDADGSGGLNSEEIAGTRLADKIGDGFYGLDGDKNGALDAAELTDFLRSEYLGDAVPETEPGEGTVADGSDVVDAAPPAPADPLPDTVADNVAPVVGDAAGVPEPPAEDVAAPATSAPADPLAAPTPGSVSSVDYLQQVRNAFEAALRVLQSDT